MGAMVTSRGIVNGIDRRLSRSAEMSSSPLMGKRAVIVFGDRRTVAGTLVRNKTNISGGLRNRVVFRNPCFKLIRNRSPKI